MKQNARPGEQSEAPRRRWKPGQEQHPGAENQDSQHMLNQARGSFPDSSAPDPLFKASEAPFLTLRVATPSGAPREAPLDCSGAEKQPKP